MFKLSTSRRFFSVATNKAFYVEKLDKGVVLFKMNRPKARNAISMEFVDEFAEAVEENQNATCVILTSATPGMFCAGADLKERKEMSPD